MPDTLLADQSVMCSEGTRVCRDGVWSGCENVHEYLAPSRPESQAIVTPNSGTITCSKCDVLCFKVMDPLTADGGTAGGNVTFGSGGGLTLLTSDAAVGDGGASNSCVELNECCYGLTEPLRSACSSTAQAGVVASCTSALATYCPEGTITGPLQGCTVGSGADTDCDGIPNAVDNAAGPPFTTTDNQTIFHELAEGESGANSIDISYRLNSADVYVLFDTTGTMAPERQNLTDLLTATNVVYCAQLAQCCGSNTTCKNTVKAANATNCYAAQITYCGGHIDCSDTDFDGAPNNELATQGVIGGIRCLIGDAQFGLGQFREIPVHDEPEQIPCLAEGCRYGDRDEQVFRNLVDMTRDHERIRAALSGISMNYNWDEPEGGFVALNSVVTGRGQYFGVNRPAVPDRSSGQDCPANTFGYPCFRNTAVPIVVMFTDAPHHNGPGTSASDWTNCNSRGAGCPYKDLGSSNQYISSAKDSASDRTAHYVPRGAERAADAFDLGDVRGQYLSMVGDTAPMSADYAGSLIGCSAPDAAPDAVISFSLSAGGDANINFHLTKDDAYPDNYYGEWNPWSLTPGTDDPTPATDFGAVVSVFRGSPDDSGSSMLKCQADAQPSTLQGSDWPSRSVDFNLSLSAGTYYVVIKGAKASSRGHFQLQIGETSAKVKTTYTPPPWTETRTALTTAGVKVLPVIATGGFMNDFVTTAEAQAALVAQASGAVRSDGTPIWYQIQNDGAQTGQAVVSSVADLSNNLAMDVTLSAMDGPDSASAFQMSVLPQNSLGCVHPHPLVDSTGACNDTSSTYDCDTQYQCRPGAAPKFRVTFTNPTSAPVPVNPSNPYGGYLFKLQLRSNHQYLLTEIPVFLIPTGMGPLPPPNQYQATGEYEQQISAKNCVSVMDPGDAGTSTSLNGLPSWGDLFFHADIPQDTSIDFQLCTANTASELSSCKWSTLPRVTVAAVGSCMADDDCAHVAGYSPGTCVKNSCRFVTPAKVFSDIVCASDASCPNAPLGSGDYIIQSYCDSTVGSPSYAHCVSKSVPLDMGATLDPLDDGKSYSSVHVTLHADSLRGSAPQLYDWYLTYSCHTAL